MYRIIRVIEELIAVKRKSEKKIEYGLRIGFLEDEI